MTPAAVRRTRPPAAPVPIGPAIDQALDEAAERWIARLLGPEADSAAGDALHRQEANGDDAPQGAA